MAYWDKIGSRGDVEDRRGMGGLALGGGGLGLTGLVIVLLFNVLSGGGGGNGQGNINDILSQLQQSQGIQQGAQPGEFAGEDTYETFASTVLGSNNDAWTALFKENGKTYTPPKLVLFRQATQSGCGLSTAQVGPHYCPADQTIYLDETFFDELKTRLGAKGGDVAEAYVISHESGHHAQYLLGTMEKTQQAMRGGGQEANEMSVKLELQADCYAGLWAKSIAHLGVFEPGEIEEAQDAAAAVGDDRIQQNVEGHVNPENWTHGSSVQRMDWFNKGYAGGKLSDCDTFK
jgi:predicted metalloprotease